MVSVFIDDDAVDAQTGPLLVAEDEVLETDQGDTDHHEDHTHDLKTGHSDPVDEPVEASPEKRSRSPDCLSKAYI